MRVSYLYLFVAAAFFSSCGDEEKKPKALPYAGNYNIVVSETDGVRSVDTIYPTIPAFHYLNQDSVVVESSQMKGKVWIANFFFSNCPSICPPMISQMKRLNILTSDLNRHLQYMSFSIDPSNDTPARLREYIRENGIEAKNWYFFTGNEAKTHRLGVEHFLVHAASDDVAPGGFAHSDGLVLVDREGYVRGVYHGTSTDEVDQLNKDIRKLLTVEYGIDCKEK